MIKKFFTWSNLTTVVLALLTIVLLISPNVKAIMIQGLMKIGLFSPPIENTEQEKTANGDKKFVPSLLLKSPDGKIFNINDQKGKVLFINFWATWCPPCIAEMPSINEMYSKYKNNPNVLILEVDVDNNFGKSVSFMKKNKYSLPVYNIASELTTYLLSETIPTTVIIDKSGVIVAKHEGGADYADEAFYNYLNGLINK